MQLHHIRKPFCHVGIIHSGSLVELDPALLIPELIWCLFALGVFQVVDPLLREEVFLQDIHVFVCRLPDQQRRTGEVIHSGEVTSADRVAVAQVIDPDLPLVDNRLQRQPGGLFRLLHVEVLHQERRKIGRIVLCPLNIISELHIALDRPESGISLHPGFRIPPFLLLVQFIHDRQETIIDDVPFGHVHSIIMQLII